jgi:hypothetical protein
VRAAIVNGRAGLVVATPYGPTGSGRGWHGVAIDPAASADRLQQVGSDWADPKASRHHD